MQGDVFFYTHVMCKGMAEGCQILRAPNCRRRAAAIGWVVPTPNTLQVTRALKPSDSLGLASTAKTSLGSTPGKRASQCTCAM